MKFKIAEVFSNNALTGAPETNYMVRKRVWGRWQDVRQFVDKFEAEIYMKAQRRLLK